MHLLAFIVLSVSVIQPFECCAQQSKRNISNYLTTKDFTIAGLPQQQYHFNVSFDYGTIQRLNFAGTVGYLIEPTGKIDPQRRWVWIAPLWLSLNSAHGNQTARHYVEASLKAGFHVVGVDVGTSLGSPKASRLMRQFHDHCVATIRLSPKARMIAVSNGGLIVYGYAFRNPEQVERILAIYPAIDFRTWPGLKRVAGASAFTPNGLAYGLSRMEMERRIREFNPIDNLQPIAKARIPIFHLHGDADELVPIVNSTQAARFIAKEGGKLKLKVLKDRGHGGKEFFNDEEATAFLIKD